MGEVNDEDTIQEGTSVSAKEHKNLALGRIGRGKVHGICSRIARTAQGPLYTESAELIFHGAFVHDRDSWRRLKVELGFGHGNVFLPISETKLHLHVAGFAN